VEPSPDVRGAGEAPLPARRGHLPSPGSGRGDLTDDPLAQACHTGKRSWTVCSRRHVELLGSTVAKCPSIGEIRTRSEYGLPFAASRRMPMVNGWIEGRRPLSDDAPDLIIEGPARGPLV
jgi:hypothetical protein